MSENTPLIEHEALKSADHREGLQHVPASVTQILPVSEELTRLVLRLPGLDTEPLWLRPNVAFRFLLDERFEQTARVYTVRRVIEGSNDIEVDIVRHGEHSPMMRWLDSLQLGDQVNIIGPRPHVHFPPAEGRDTVVFADSTAIPALYSLLAQAPAQLRGRGWVATTDQLAFDELPQLEHFILERIEPGKGFGRELRSLEHPESLVVWGAGERDDMREVRSFFRQRAQLGKDRVAVFGYWKRGVSNTRIDQVRLEAYSKLLAAGSGSAELDDLELQI
ncbi:siderophore-interacting protein [Glutamicibacter sp. NPDC087344]|uniref:siderophore-interacting protein n=1 Tax=Glutamicibacter sp. NPDC087344 TaxID=3363994 RepID=UPI0037F6E8A4